MTEILFQHSERQIVSDTTALNARKSGIYGQSETGTDNFHFEKSSRYAVNALFSILVLLSTFFLMRWSDSIDRSIITLLNDYGTLHPSINWIMYRLDNDSIYSGVAMMMLIWWCWFEAGQADRVKLFAGTLVAFPAGIVSRFLQHQLSSHPRPAYNPLQNFKIPEELQDGIYNTWNSFPSDHATVFFGLVITAYIFRPKIGLIAGLYLAIIESSRIFMGAHYLTDLIGGAALAAAVVWAAQAPAVLALAGRVVQYERISPSWFYAAAFLVSYQVATLFSDVRNLTGGFHIIGLFR